MEGPEIWPRDSLSYRQVVATFSFLFIFQCGSLAAKALRDGGIRAVGFPASHQQSAGSASYHRSTRWNRTRHATLKQGSIAVLCGVSTLIGTSCWNGTCNPHRLVGRWLLTAPSTSQPQPRTAAFLSTLDKKPVHVVLCILVAASRWVDASYAWERFLLVHPDFQPTRRQVLWVRLYIFVGLRSVVWLMGEGARP